MANKEKTQSMPQLNGDSSSLRFLLFPFRFCGLEQKVLEIWEAVHIQAFGDGAWEVDGDCRINSQMTVDGDL